MANEQLPISPTVLSWARERAGYSLEEAAEKFKKIADWESGEESPTYGQLETLAETFKIPIAVFFFPDPPRLPPIRESFRTLPDTEFDRLPRQVAFLLRKAKALQLNLAELCDGRNPAERLIVRDISFGQRTNAERMASDVRDYLRVSFEEQVSWADADAALKNWRHKFFEVGVFVFKDAFRAESFSGFCLYDGLFPIIYVNNSHSRTRQIFTLFHELGHLLFHTSGVDGLTDDTIQTFEGRSRQVEVLCNRFAAEFLVPSDVFSAAMRGLLPTEDSAAQLANRFHVSREFIFRKFLDLGLIGEAEYKAAAVKWAQQSKRLPGGDAYWTKITYLGREYIELALRRYYQNRIDERQLGDYLDWKPKNIHTLEEYFAKGGE